MYRAKPRVGIVYFKDGHTEDVIKWKPDGAGGFYFCTNNADYVYKELSEEEKEIINRPRPLPEKKIPIQITHGFKKIIDGKMYVAEEILKATFC